MTSEKLRNCLRSLKSSALRVYSLAPSLTSTPRPSGCHKLKGAANLWRIRVGDYRVLYAINDHSICTTYSALSR